MERVHRDSIDSKIIDDLRSGVIENTYTNKHKEENLENLIYHFRNAISHGHIEPYADKNKEISVLCFHEFTSNKNKPDANFQIKVEISFLREFVLAFAEGLIKTYEN